MHGLQTLGRVISDEYGTLNLPLKFDAFGGDILADYLKAYGPIDVFLTIWDVWLPQASYLPSAVNKFRPQGMSWIHHITILSAPLSPWLHAAVEPADVIVAPSKFNLKVLQDAGLGSKSLHIPHGCDTSIYKPIPETREELRRELGYEDKFVFLTVGRNKGLQKAWPILFHAFKTMIENRPELKDKVLLHCHTCPDEAEGMRLDLLRDRVGLRDHVKFTQVRPTEDWRSITVCNEAHPNAMLHQPNFGLDERGMCCLYNMADCFVLASQGESFSLPTLESMACGLPVVAPNFSAPVELVNDSKAGLLAKIKTMMTTPLISDTALVDELDLARCMYQMYEDENFRKECSRNAVGFARKLDWKNVVPQWLKLLDQVQEAGLKPDYSRGILGV